MIISESKKFIFLHNPKCAGTSIRVALKDFDTRANYYWGFSEFNECKIDKAHMPLNIFRKFAPDDFRLLSSYFVFGFVRNPYSRAISAFNETHPFLYKEFKENKVSFAEYQNKLNIFIQQLTKNNISGWQFKFRHFIRQTDLFWLENKLYADLVIKVEDLKDSLHKLNVFLPEVSIELNSKIKNKNERPLSYEPKQILSAESINIINTIYCNDFAIFDYALIK